LLFATSGSTIGLILLIAFSLLMWKIIRMCETSNQTKENNYIAVIENECLTHKKMCRDKNVCDDDSIEIADTSKEQKLDSDKTTLECKIKKPPFQQRRQ